MEGGRGFRPGPSIPGRSMALNDSRCAGGFQAGAAHSNPYQNIPHNSQSTEKAKITMLTPSVARRPLGNTGLDVPCVAFGTGPVAALWTSAEKKIQDETLRRALELGVNWFDTAAGYGQGASERNLGAALRRADAWEQVDVATKVRLEGADLDDIPAAIRRSVAASLARLGTSRVTLLQLHNSVTERRGDEATSLTSADVLGPGGVADTFDQLRAEGICRVVGFTGLGQASALRRLVLSGRFQTMQIPFSLANPSAGFRPRGDVGETDYGEIFRECATQGLGVFAIRVFAGGALAGHPPSEYTRTTRFFKLDLYQRDQARADRLRAILAPDEELKAAAVRFALTPPVVSSAIVGLSSTEELDEVVRFAASGPLAADLVERLMREA